MDGCAFGADPAGRRSDCPYVIDLDLDRGVTAPPRQRRVHGAAHHRIEQRRNDAPMQRTRFDNRECPVAQALEIIGEWWSLLIVRDALRGLRRFEAFQASLGIARNMLSLRLKALVAAGILEMRAYSERPVRYEYRLTAKGSELMP